MTSSMLYVICQRCVPAQGRLSILLGSGHALIQPQFSCSTSEGDATEIERGNHSSGAPDTRGET